MEGFYGIYPSGLNDTGLLLFSSYLPPFVADVVPLSLSWSFSPVLPVKGSRTGIFVVLCATVKMEVEADSNDNDVFAPLKHDSEQ